MTEEAEKIAAYLDALAEKIADDQEVGALICAADDIRAGKHLAADTPA